jgi:hypothetical protein
VSLRTGQPVREVVMGVDQPDGKLSWIWINAEPLCRDGETTPYAAVTTFADVIGSIAVITDITARKETENKLQAALARNDALEAEIRRGLCPACQAQLRPDDTQGTE